ncbi:unnamed protein product [Bursaphelenchus xylophilus]|uniref:legumain n=1 Tax=Bursaphelenchus xylophilus TaxID=6326 RepID=A0A1I7SFY7_BURXY|nr:unnamed protein product [Bursaphelenchus xylophilus]CAG9104536.1 unnamed protein product [Bursaphelenchus xylophilus]
MFRAVLLVSLARLVLSSPLEKTLPKNDEEGDIHAVIVVGSEGFDNYRHQANGCHAYHVLREHGVKEENIITMMYDNIVNDTLNPHRGKLFHDPSFKRDVYDGCQIDYKGKNVTVENFIHVLTGNKTNEVQRVLNSTENDRVFVYYTDHGGKRLLQFPDNLLTDKQLLDVLKTMQTKRMFKEMLLFVDACFSGSMVEETLNGFDNILALTSANNNESSYETYCYNISGSLMEWCLASQFGAAWMEYAEANDLNEKTIKEQYDYVRVRTNESHAGMYGNKEMGKKRISEFLGTKLPKVNRTLDLTKARPYTTTSECPAHGKRCQNCKGE